MEKTTPERMEAAQLWESFADYWNKDVEELTEVEAAKVLKRLREVLETNPSISSTYPGESEVSGSIISEETL